MHRLPFAVALVLSLPFLAPAQTAGWTYNPNARESPIFWGSVLPQYATCGSAQPLAQPFVEVGLKQTPIDIVSSKAIPAELTKLSFHYDDTPLDVENTGHVEQVVYAPGSYLKFGKVVTDVYNLVQFHFHVPSEHTIDGKSFDGEVHLNHINLLGEQVIVTIFLSQSTGARSSIYDDIVAQAPVSIGVNRGKGRTVNAADLLPNNTRSYYTYDGSGSTPPCAEGVRRIVLAKPVSVTPAVIRQLRSLAGGFIENGGFQNNNRPVTPLNGRNVLVVR
jgi:carbonic anhydrase